MFRVKVYKNKHGDKCIAIAAPKYDWERCKWDHSVEHEESVNKRGVVGWIIRGPDEDMAELADWAEEMNVVMRKKNRMDTVMEICNYFGFDKNGQINSVTFFSVIENMGNKRMSRAFLTYNTDLPRMIADEVIVAMIREQWLDGDMKLTDKGRNESLKNKQFIESQIHDDEKGQQSIDELFKDAR